MCRRRKLIDIRGPRELRWLRQELIALGPRAERSTGSRNLSADPTCPPEGAGWEFSVRSETWTPKARSAPSWPLPARFSVIGLQQVHWVRYSVCMGSRRLAHKSHLAVGTAAGRGPLHVGMYRAAVALETTIRKRIRNCRPQIVEADTSSGPPAHSQDDERDCGEKAQNQKCPKHQGPPLA